MSGNKVSVSFASLLYDRMQALQSGEVQAQGVDLNFIALAHPRDIFDRMAGGLKFDASELSLSEYICRYAAGHRNLTALPVFPSRAFRHGFIAVDSRAVREPRDLNGKSVGVQLYTMTAAVWIRAVLARHKVDPSSIRWVQGSMESAEPHGRPSAMPLTRPASIEQNDSGRSLSQLIEDGEIAATIVADLPVCFGRAPHVARLFPDHKAVEKAYFREMGVFPIMHTVVVRTELCERHSWLATSLYNALDDSKEVGRIRMRNLDALRYTLPWLASDLDEIGEVFGGDPWQNGLDANRKTLEALVDALHEQAMIPEKVKVDELFATVRGQNWKLGWGPTLATR